MILLLIAFGVASPILDEASVDMIELNHVLDKKTARPIYSQIIFWRNVHHPKMEMIPVGFVIANKLPDLPVRDSRGGAIAYVYRSGIAGSEGQKRIAVRSRLYKVSVTSFDVEAEAKQRAATLGIDINEDIVNRD